jgi:hypothetical protein
MRQVGAGLATHPLNVHRTQFGTRILTAEFLQKYRKKSQHEKKALATDFFRKKKTLQHGSPTRGPRTACNTPGSIMRLAATFVNYAGNIRIEE